MAKLKDTVMEYNNVQLNNDDYIDYLQNMYDLLLENDLDEFVQENLEQGDHVTGSWED